MAFMQGNRQITAHSRLIKDIFNQIKRFLSQLAQQPFTLFRGLFRFRDSSFGPIAQLWGGLVANCGVWPHRCYWKGLETAERRTTGAAGQRVMAQPHAQHRAGAAVAASSDFRRRDDSLFSFMRGPVSHKGRLRRHLKR